VVAAIGVSVPGIPSPMRVTQPAFVFFEYLIWGSIGVWIYVKRRNELRARERMAATRLMRARTQRRALEAQLQALQAQVEPRFLLDTLARVRDRYDVDAAKGSAMLGALIAYLRTALPRLRESSSSIGREIDLVRAYVDVMRVSAGSAIDMAQSVRDARMPAMLLLPLVNLAVRRRCDAIRIRARQDAGKLRVSVSQGASAVADEDRQELADIRARLRALYNEEARLTFVDEHGARVCAMVEIPHEPVDGGHR
jgi:LytS/YehU family sensor histidine kinase